MQASTQAYLARDFLAQDQLAAAAGIPEPDLSELVDRGLMPSPSYRVEGDTLVSAAFGAIPCAGLMSGHYFHGEMIQWLRLALDTVAAHDAAEAQASLRSQFQRQAATEIALLHRDGLRLAECFDDSGAALDGLRQRLDDHWQAHMAGIFGVCVRHPGSVAAIVLKETLQTVISRSSDDGKHLPSEPKARMALRSLIERYAEACAPFAPVEYPLSSRRRYLEDVLPPLR
ncbi:MAG TPA: DUF6058 family natural product biosynthesis protein [Xanthomonadaceae bacterium]|nr:DUF6058 family natural product biosynthesis protein [Xanthomonadaceae bacterium]